MTPTPVPVVPEKKEPIAEKKEPKKIGEPLVKKEVEPKKKEPDPVKKNPEPVKPAGEALAVIPLQGTPSPFNPAGFTVDNRLVVHGQPKGCLLRDWQTGQVVRPLPLGPSWLLSLAFLPDGKHILAAGADFQLRLCDLQTGKVVRLFGQPRSPTMSIAIGAAGRFALTGGGSIRGEKGKQERIELEVKLWDLATGKLVREYHGCPMPIRKVAFSKDGRYVFASSWDRQTRSWDRASGGEGEPKRLALALEPHLDMVFSRDGTQALFRPKNPRSLVLWDLAKDEQIRELTPNITNIIGWALDLSPDHRLIVVADGKDHNLLFLDAVTGQILQKCRGHTDTISNLAFSPDGRYVLSQARDQTLRVWAVPTLP